MSNARLALWVIALAVGFFAVAVARRPNPTALALLLAFAASQVGLPHDLYACPDALTIAFIMMKSQRCYLEGDGWWHEIKCLVLERSPADAFILLSFPLAWGIYVSDLHHFYWWWSLTIIAVAQFIAAGSEPLLQLLRDRRNADMAICPPAQSGDLLVAFGRRLA
jgi:hypothetical protein